MPYPYYSTPYQYQRNQQSGFVLVQSEQDVTSYPVAPGNSISFKIENQPYCYVKTMGFNPMEGPVIEKYKLVKEDAPQNKNSLAAVWAEIDKINEKIRAMEVNHEPTNADKSYHGRTAIEPPATKPDAGSERVRAGYTDGYDEPIRYNPAPYEHRTD